MRLLTTSRSEHLRSPSIELIDHLTVDRMEVSAGQEYGNEANHRRERLEKGEE
jgi:hypothetical protein